MGAKIPQQPPPRSRKPEQVPPPPPPKKGNPGMVERLLMRIEKLEAALREISESKFCSYEASAERNGNGNYSVGVTDGHRYCARIANEALAD